MSRLLAASSGTRGISAQHKAERCNVQRFGIGARIFVKALNLVGLLVAEERIRRNHPFLKIEV
jgi:hypothetical protein